jgi:hypothetical protein
MITCSKSGCIDCHRTLLAWIRNEARNHEQSKRFWGDVLLTSPDKQELLDALNEYAAYRVVNPVKPQPRGRRKKSQMELEDDAWLAWMVLAYRRENPSASLESAFFWAADLQGVSESKVRDAYLLFTVNTRKS